MRQYERYAKLKEHTELCAGLVEKILDIADEAYRHTQKMDSKEIDPRNWYEWTQLFINQSASETAESTGAEVEAAESERLQSALLNEIEMVDYIKNRGQWTKELVANNKPNLEQIVNPPVEQVVTGKKGAPVKGNQAV
jgi:hypothetical protein